MDRSKMLTGAAASALLALAAGVLVAGPLTPPAGSVAPTYKTLTDIEPRTPVSSSTTPGGFSSVYRITQPGSYYLTGNVAGAAGKSGIEISADGVTLDLRGFTVQGVSGSSDGIWSTARFTVRNGLVRGFGGRGIFGQGVGCVVEDVTSELNTGDGIQLGNNARVRNCTARGNSQDGLQVGSDSVVVSCMASNNGQLITHHGITVADRCTVSGCTSSSNMGSGIDANQSCRISDSTASFNRVGISTYFGGNISGCVAGNNTNDGINAGDRTTIRECDCTGNGDDGIQVADECVVERNSCVSNGPDDAGAGIYIVGSQCRIDENHLNFNRYGVLAGVNSPDNFVTRNTAKNNLGGNFNVAAGNDMAPVVNNPGATFTGATPWSNFAY